MNKFKRPKKFDRNLIVIGAGAAGLVAAYLAAALRAKVTLIEQDRMGGECLYTGCIPSKALIRSARLVADARRARELGFRRVELDFDFAEIMDRVRRVIRTIEPHDSIERYTALGVECIRGHARLTSPWTVDISGRALSAPSIIIAAGARPDIPRVEGIDSVSPLTSDTVWDLRSLPGHLLVMGGGPVGCELAQCFARFGSQVTQVEMLPRLLIREDPEVSQRVADALHRDGINVMTGRTITQFRHSARRPIAVCGGGAEATEIEFDALLVATGRKANTEGYGLEELGIPLTPAGTIAANSYLQTGYPNIYVCGDAAGPYQFTHMASHQAWYAAMNALFRGIWRFKVDYSVVPWATFTDPEVARTGLNETDARERGIPCEASVYGIEDLDRAIADEDAAGMVKVLTRPGTDRILGATIVGAHASDLIVEFITAMRNGIGLNRILGTIHIYPTFTEASKYAAGVWRRAHTPGGLLRWLERFHAWRRG